MKLTPTRRGILALAVVEVIGVGVSAMPKGYVGEHWSTTQFLAHYISSLTEYVFIAFNIILGMWFVIAGPKKP